VSPIEEATAYKRLADTGRYEVASLAVRFGKSEGYIRGRMKLNDLTDDLSNLVDEDVIPVSVALELCKYGRETQEIIFQKHMHEPQYYNDDWRNLTAKEMVKRLDSRYNTDLNRYHFDKSECRQCALNTNCFNLFPEVGNEGKCMNASCLAERNKQYLVTTCREIISLYPDVEICKPQNGNVNEEVYAELSEQGYGVDTTSKMCSFPECPEQPVRCEDDDDESFAEIQADFEDEKEEYRLKINEIEQMFADGKAKRVLVVKFNEPEYRYVVEKTDEEIAMSASKNDTDPKCKLLWQDRRNREIAVENIVEDTRQLIRNTELPQSDFTEIEEKYLYYAMLSDVKREHIPILTQDPENDRWHLTDEEKIQIIDNLTEELKTLIRRDYLVKHLSDAFGVAKKSYLMLEFARLHFPDEVAETEVKYNDVYTKRHAKIEQRLKALETAKQAEDAGSAEEIECAEDLKEVA
jgi:ParB family chromosome partitioning protein